MCTAVGVDPQPTNARIYEEARTAHFERLVDLAPARFIFRTRRYDFDHALAGSSSARNWGRLRTVGYLLRRRPGIVELNEPTFLKAWPSLLLYLAAVRISNTVAARKISVVAYAIDNADVAAAFSDHTHLPMSVSRMLVRVVLRFMVKGYSKISFGTSDAMRAYETALGEPPQVETSHFPALPKACTCARSPKQEKVVFLGAFEDRKGIRLLMSSWDTVRESAPGARLTLLGKGPLEEEVKFFANSRREVDFVVDPSRDEVHSQLRAAKVVVLLSQKDPRWREQIGLPILEGLAHGCEVVASNETGVAGWLDENRHAVIDSRSSSRYVGRTVARVLGSAREPDEILRHLPDEDGRVTADAWLFGRTD